MTALRHRPLQSQRGVTLVISLMMLVILTVLVLATTNLSSANLKVVGNAQSKATVEAATQQAIERTISSIAAFSAPATQSMTINGVIVNVAPPVCLNHTAATGYSAISGISPEDTHWEVRATGTDALSGATATLRQGVRIKLPTGWCV